MLKKLSCALFVLFGFGTAIQGSQPDARGYDEHVRPFFARHCLECHGTEKPKGNLRLDQLAPDFAGQESQERWLAVREQLEAGAMPPESKPRPPEEEAEAVSQWIDGQVTAAEAVRRATQGRVVLRRLNRIEYENTVRDLLGVRVDLKEMLPQDSAAAGFDNVGEALHASSFLMERYLEATDVVLNAAIANGPQPATIKKRYDCKDERQIKAATERVFRHRDDALVCFSSSHWNAVTLGQFYPPDQGTYRFRIAASGFQSAGKPVTYSIQAGSMLMAGKNHLVGYFDAPADELAVAEFVDHLEARSTIRLLPYGLANAQAVNKVGADSYEGAGLAIHWVEVEGPLYESWPPPSHRRLFGDLAQAPVPGASNRKRVEVVSQDPEGDARRVLGSFARRAYRRSVTSRDIEPLVALVRTSLAEKSTFEQALRVGLMGAMLAPDFLFLRE
jgi:hypothetical protein